MFSVRYSVCFALLLACACARPGTEDTGNNINDNKIENNEITTVSSASPSAATSSSTAVPVVVSTLLPSKDPEVPSTTSSTETPKVEATSAPTVAQTVLSKNQPIPVNLKYPSALLYGGTCGGTIISPTWILTAAHCSLFTGSSYGFVLAGTNNSNDGSGVTREIKRQVVHPRFSVGPYWLDANEFNISQVAARWDFMLAELAEPLPLDDKTIVAAKLDHKPKHRAGVHVGFAGYGTDHYGGFMRDEMHEMQLEIQADEVCSKALEQYDPKDMICTRGRQPRMDSACSGDSGSGLIDESGRLLGAASWVQNDSHDCFNGALVVFSRIASVSDWIRQVTNI